MHGDSRQQRRKLVREQQKTGERALRAGLNPTPPAATVLAITRVVRSKLEERGNSRRAGEAAALAHALVEASLAAWPARVQIACRRGCNYCCHSYVAVTAPEVFRLARAVEASRLEALAPARIRERAQPLIGVGVAERIGAKLACPLLVGGECAVYAERPIVCRQATSLSVAACRDEYDSPDREGQVEISAAHVTHASNANVILVAALTAVRLPSVAYEMAAALDAALALPDAEARWLAGEDVFRDVARHAPRSAEIDSVARRIARDLGD